MTYMAVKFNFQQVLLKTLIPTMNTLKDMVVLNIIKTDSRGQAGGLGIFTVIFNFNQLCIKNLILGRILRAHKEEGQDHP